MRATENPLPLCLCLLGLLAGCPRPQGASPASAVADASAAAPIAKAPVRKQPEPPASADAAQAEAPAAPSGVEACVDAWLAARKLDRYGSPEGTMYMGGTPLFDERTGERKDRLTFVFQKHPEARNACAPDASVPAPGGRVTE